MDKSLVRKRITLVVMWCASQIPHQGLKSFYPSCWKCYEQVYPQLSISSLYKLPWLKTPISKSHFFSRTPENHGYKSLVLLLQLKTAHKRHPIFRTSHRIQWSFILECSFLSSQTCILPFPSIAIVPRAFSVKLLHPNLHLRICFLGNSIYDIYICSLKP